MSSPPLPYLFVEQACLAQAYRELRETAEIVNRADRALRDLPLSVDFPHPDDIFPGDDLEDLLQLPR